MFVFELSSDNDEVEVHLDLAGLEEFEKHLAHLRQGESHVHLKTASWGGDELSEDPQSENHRVVNHVKIFLWRGREQ